MTRNDAATDAKRVLCILFFNEDRSRPPSGAELPELCERALKDLELLEQRGHSCGLTDVLEALRKQFVPLFIAGLPSGESS